MTKLLNKTLITSLSFLFFMAASPLTSAAENPFGMSDKSGTHMQVAGKCGDSMKESASGTKMKKDKCGEGKCGGSDKKKDKCGEGKCGGSDKKKGKSADKAKKKDKCGEGKCGGSDKKKSKSGEG